MSIPSIQSFPAVAATAQNLANFSSLPGTSAGTTANAPAGRKTNNTLGGNRVANAPLGQTGTNVKPSGGTAGLRLAQAVRPTTPEFDKRGGNLLTPDEKLNLPALNQRFETGAKTQDMLKSLATWERIGMTSRNVSLASSAKEQAQGVWNNVVTNATLEVNTLTAVANRINVLYGLRVIDLNNRQQALASINVNIAKLRAVVDVANASISRIGLSNSLASAKQDTARLDLTLKTWKTTIGAAQKSISSDLKLADQQVAQLKVNAKGELISGKIALQNISDEITNTASQTAKSAYLPEALTSVDTDKRNGVALPPKISRGGVQRTDSQRLGLLQNFYPFLKGNPLKSTIPNPAEKTSPYTINGIESRAGAASYTKALESLKTRYSSLENAAKALKLNNGTQLKNLIQSVQSGKFDASKLDKNYSTLHGTTDALLKEVSSLPAKLSASLDSYPTRDQLTNGVKLEFSKKIVVPQALKDYAKKVGADVDLLVSLAYVNLAQDKAEAVTDGALDIGVNPVSPASYIKAAKNLSRLASTEKLTAVGNSLGNIVRVNRLLLAYKNLVLSQEVKNIAWQNLDNTINNYGLGLGAYRENVATVTKSLGAIKTQQQSLKNNYMSNVISQKRVGVSQDQLTLLRKQYELANLNLESIAQGKTFALSVGKERLALGTASNSRKIYDANVTKVLREMTRWNSTYAANAFKYDKTDYPATGSGLTIPPTVMSKVMGGQDRAPTASELRRASDITMLAFHDQYPDSANMIKSGTPAAKAAVQYFLTGNPAAVTSRSPVQEKTAKPPDVDDKTPRRPFNISGSTSPNKSTTVQPSRIPVPQYSQPPVIDQNPAPGTRSEEKQREDYVNHATPYDPKK